MYRVRFLEGEEGSLGGFLCYLPDHVFASQYGNTGVEAEAAEFPSPSEALDTLDAVRRLFSSDQRYMLESRTPSGDWVVIEEFS